MYKLKEFSYLTKGPVYVAVPWIDNESSFLYDKYKIINFGLVIAADSVYSMITGSVVHVCHDKFGSYVTLQYDADTCVRYCLLSSVDVSAGQSVEVGQKIGTTYKSMKGVADVNLFRFEYCNRQSSQAVVRFSRQTYYKQDPEPILLNEENYQFNPQSQMYVSNRIFYDDPIIRNKEFMTNGR